jgi:hypothetical protein
MLRIRGDRASLLAALATNWAHQQLGLSAPVMGFSSAQRPAEADDTPKATVVVPLRGAQQRHNGDTAPAR